MTSLEDETDSAVRENCANFHRVIHTVYEPVHGYVELTICMLGFVANSITVAVFSRKEMASSTNSLLTSLAVADLIVMIFYIPHEVYLHTSIISDHESYKWIFFVFFISICAGIFHTISVLITVILAVWRYIAIKFPLQSSTICNKRNTSIAIALAYVMGPILLFAPLSGLTIEEIQPTNYQHVNIKFIKSKIKNGTSSYTPQFKKNKPLWTVAYWMYSLFVKFVPCVVLSILYILLIIEMKLSDRRRQKLIRHSPITNEADNARLKNTQNINRTTRMLVALLGLFLLTELPMAIICLLYGVSRDRFKTCYEALIPVKDLLVLFGSAVNFVVYCSMSQQFRKTFARLVRKLMPLPSISSRLW